MAKIIRSYLDTCIVSGIARSDLKPEQQSALANILIGRTKSSLALFTSVLAREEIQKIPAAHRRQHEAIYEGIASMDMAQEYRPDLNLAAVGAGGGLRPDPLLLELRAFLPGEMDARHLFQAIKNEVDVFLTVDHKTILRFQQRLLEAYDIRVLSPTELLAIDL